MRSLGEKARVARSFLSGEWARNWKPPSREERQMLAVADEACKAGLENAGHSLSGLSAKPLPLSKFRSIAVMGSNQACATLSQMTRVGSCCCRAQGSCELARSGRVSDLGPDLASRWRTESMESAVVHSAAAARAWRASAASAVAAIAIVSAVAITATATMVTAASTPTATATSTPTVFLVC